MSEAAILNLESYRQESLEQKFRERVHRELDRCLDIVGDVMDDKEKPSGLWGMTEGIRKHREELSVLDISPTADEIGDRIRKVSQGRKWRPIKAGN